jgi:hypothetical protein
MVTILVIVLTIELVVCTSVLAYIIEALGKKCEVVIKMDLIQLCLFANVLSVGYLILTCVLR